MYYNKTLHLLKFIIFTLLPIKLLIFIILVFFYWGEGLASNLIGNFLNLFIYFFLPFHPFNFTLFLYSIINKIIAWIVTCNLKEFSKRRVDFEPFTTLHPFFWNLILLLNFVCVHLLINEKYNTVEIFYYWLTTCTQ